MNRVVLSAAAALLALAQSAQATAPGAFYGTLWFSSANAGCGIANQKFSILYYPPNVGPNGPSTNFTISRGGDGIGAWTSHYSLESGDVVGTTYVPMKSTSIFAQRADSFQASVRFTVQSPASPTTATHTLHLVGDIKKFDGGTCDGHFDATLNSYPVP